MRQHLRPQRNVFLLFLGATFVALMTALPLVTAQTQQPQEEKPVPQTAQQPQQRRPSGIRAGRPQQGRSCGQVRSRRSARPVRQFRARRPQSRRQAGPRRVRQRPPNPAGTPLDVGASPGEDRHRCHRCEAPRARGAVAARARRGAQPRGTVAAPARGGHRRPGPSVSHHRHPGGQRRNPRVHQRPCPLPVEPRQGALPRCGVRGFGQVPVDASRAERAAREKRAAPGGVLRLRDRAALLDRALRAVARRLRAVEHPQVWARSSSSSTGAIRTPMPARWTMSCTTS